MEFKKIEANNYQAFLNLYNENFPENERRLYRNEESLDQFIREKDGKFNILVITESDESLLGFISFWIFKKFIYIEHFAVTPNVRGKGLGSSILKYICTHVSRNLLLEVEPPETEEAINRIRFYSGNGFRLLENIEYIQPPYSESQSGMKLMLMTYGDVEITGISDLKEMLKEVYNKDI